MRHNQTDESVLGVKTLKKNNCTETVYRYQKEKACSLYDVAKYRLKNTLIEKNMFEAFPEIAGQNNLPKCQWPSILSRLISNEQGTAF